MDKYETDIETKVADDALLLHGIFSIKIMHAQASGYPDRIFLIVGGVPLFIEFKRPGKPLSTIQKLIHRRLRHAGYKVETHDTYQGAMQAIIRAKVEAAALHEARGEVAGGTKRRCALTRPRTAQD